LEFNKRHGQLPSLLFRGTLVLTNISKSKRHRRHDSLSPRNYVTSPLVPSFLTQATFHTRCSIDKSSCARVSMVARYVPKTFAIPVGMRNVCKRIAVRVSWGTERSNRSKTLQMSLIGQPEAQIEPFSYSKTVPVYPRAVYRFLGGSIGHRRSIADVSPMSMGIFMNSISSWCGSKAPHMLSNVI
jgi:hypothetical protein